MSLKPSWRWPLGLGVLLGCFPTTTRPAFSPLPSAAMTEVELGVPEATRALALALHADSIPVRRTEPKDGWLESDWFDVRTLKPTTQRRLGPDVVKVRAWIDPTHPSVKGDSVHSTITVETVYRPVADPSRADRELDKQVPSTHPIAGRMVALTLNLAKLYGRTSTDSVVAPPPATPVKKP